MPTPETEDKNRVSEEVIDDPKKRQGNYVADFNDLDQSETQAVTEQQQQPQRTNTDRMNELFALRQEKPVYDANRPEELKRLARNATLAKGLNLIGDNIAIAKGANVNRERPDDSEKGYLNSMYNFMDDYAKRVDNWNWRDFSNKMRVGELALNQQNWDRAFDQRQFNADRAYGLQVSDQNQKQQNWERSFDQKQDQFDKELQLGYDKYKQSAEYQSMTAQERERHNRQMELASMIRAERTGSGSTKEPFKIFDNKGNKIELEGSEREKLLTLIMTDTNLTDEDLDILLPKMGEPVSTNSINLLVQKYWLKSPSAQDYLQQRYGSEGPQAAKPEEQAPSEIDYSNLKF